MIPLVPDVPLDPEVPLIPLVPLVPLDPEIPDVPLVPDVPLDPDEPLDPDVPLVPEPPPESNSLQLLLGPPPATPSIVDPVQASINAWPATLLFLTVVPKSEITTVGPPGPVDPVALFHNVV